MNAEWELFILELGYRATFDLYHHDGTFYCKHGQRDIEGECKVDPTGTCDDVV
jgi:hypothetical protein